MTPASFSARRLSSVTIIPHGAMTLRNPLAVARRTRSRMSGRNIGSPPVQMIIVFSSESIMRRHSSVESSLSYATFAAAARQWRHFNGHCRVTSHANTRGIWKLAFIRMRLFYHSDSPSSSPPSAKAIASLTSRFRGCGGGMVLVKYHPCKFMSRDIIRVPKAA